MISSVELIARCQTPQDTVGCVSREVCGQLLHARLATGGGHRYARPESLSKPIDDLDDFEGKI